jgi:hypothetical protein
VLARRFCCSRSLLILVKCVDLPLIVGVNLTFECTPRLQYMAVTDHLSYWKKIWWRLLQHGVVGAGGHGWPMKRGTTCPCGWQHAAASSRDTQALQLWKHAFWTCTGASAIRRAIQHNLPRECNRGSATATTACVAARAMPNSEEGCVVCCVPRCLINCHVES